jgi:hypothetical protein
MAVTTLTATALTKNTVSADLPVTSFTAIDADKTMKVAYPREGKLVLILNNTFAGSKVFTISAGEYIANGVGSLAITMAQDDVRFLVLDSDRFKDFDGNVSIEFADSTTGYVGALSLPY